MLRSRSLPSMKKYLGGGTRFLCIALALLIVCAALPPLNSGAVTQADIQALKDKQSAISSDKRSLQEKIAAIQDDKAQAVAKKALIEEQIEVIRQELAVINTLIAQLDTQIAEKTLELEAAQAEETRYTERFLKRVRNMEEQGSVSYLAVMFNSASFSDLLDNMNAINEIVEYDQRVIDELERIKLSIAEMKAELEAARAEQQAAKAQLEASQAELQQQQKAVAALVEQIRAAEAEYQSQLHDMEKDAASIAREIAAAEAKYAAELAAQAGNLSGSGGFVWPLPGYSSLSSTYGWRNCPFHGREFHSGIDIPAKAGTPIIAAKAGIVIISTYHNSYGNYVVIAHADGGKTLYAHMSSRAVSVGQTVNQKQTIGYVGTTGSSTGNHLHFEVWRGSTSSTRTNPMNYF